jgi:pentatricopeptide repeat protein
MWPKSTLDGVRSAISSRKVVSSTMQAQFQRAGELIGEAEMVQEFELTLTRPMGIHIEDTPEGYVQISGFTDDISPTVRNRLKVGDRIIAVDSSFGGTMWPVSNVEGIVSSVTTRLPGQPVQIRFERVIDEGTDFSDIESVSKAEAKRQQAKAASSLQNSLMKSYTNISRPDSISNNKELLDRCRGVLKRYISIYDPLQDRTKDVPAVVADRVLESLANSAAFLDANLLSLVMNAYIICNKPQKALDAFATSTGFKSDGSIGEVSPRIKSVRSDTQSLNICTATDAIRAHSQLGDIESCKRILVAIQGKESMIKGHAAGDWSHYMKPDTKFYNAILAAFVSENEFEAAEKLFNEMQPKKSLVTFNTMIAAYAKAGKRKEAFEAFKELKKSGLKPDHVSITSLIKVVVDDDDFDTARNLLKDMKRAGIKADVVAYNTIIRQLCARYKWFEAKDLVADMESNGVEPNAKTYGLLMNGLLKLNKPGPCLTLFESAISDPKTSMMMENVQLYTTAVTAASTLGDFERAVELVQRMTFAGVKPNIKTLTSLMGACVTAAKYNYSLDVYKKITKPDGYSKILAIRSHCGKGDFLSALNIIEQDKASDQVMSGRDIVRSCNHIILSSLSAKDYENSQKGFALILDYGLVPSKQTFASMVDALDLNRKGKVSGNHTTSSDDDDTKKFKYLLSVLDARAARKLACSGQFYVGLLNHASKIGGRSKKIGFAISNAKVDSSIRRVDIESNHVTNQEQQQQQKYSWLELYTKYLNDKDALENVSLPAVKVNMNLQDTRKVLLAESTVSVQRQKVKKV